MEHLFFDSIDEMRNQTGSHGPNYLATIRPNGTIFLRCPL